MTYNETINLLNSTDIRYVTDITDDLHNQIIIYGSCCLFTNDSKLAVVANNESLNLNVKEIATIQFNPKTKITILTFF